MESKSLRQFRRKMANPLHWRKAIKVFSCYTKAEAGSTEGSLRLIDDLAMQMNVPLSAEERKQAAQWLMNQGIDPQSRVDQMGLWKKVK